MPIAEPTSTQDIYNEALALGGSVLQADVAAALGGGIESGIGGGYGQPQSLELSGGIGPAQGLFQFEPGTWTGGAGGGKNGLPGTVAAASWEQQVQGFINDTGGPGGSNFGAWGPDVVAARGNPNSSSNPAYGYSGAPQPGSVVGNAIAQYGPAWAAGKGPGALGPADVGGASLASSSTAQTAALNANPFDLFGIPQTAAAATWGLVGPFLAKAMLVVGGIGLVLLGLNKATGNPAGKAAKTASVAAVAA